MAAKTSTVNISFRTDLLEEIDYAAREESRTRSELIREAARAYLERKHRWNEIFAQCESVTRQNGLKEVDIYDEIRAARSDESASS